jgi:hypothetical protein
MSGQQLVAIVALDGVNVFVAALQTGFGAFINVYW